MKIEKDRGREFIGFTDMHNNMCALSTLFPLFKVNSKPEDAIAIGGLDNSIFLDKPLLEKLMPHLQAWLKTGSFEIQEEKDAFDDLAILRQKLIDLRILERKYRNTSFPACTLNTMIEALDLVAARNNQGEAQATLDGYREIYPELFESENGE